MKQEVLRMERIYCQESGVAQLEDFSLSILSGEIMGLLPVNNHGLTALLRLLQHNTPLRYGYVYYREEQVNTWRASKQRNNRIGLIQSESCLVEGLTVADNIFVLRRGFKPRVIRPSVLRRQLLPFLESIDIYISADAYVGELSAFEKIVVDVLKSVVAGCKLIVLRELNSNICEEELKKIHRLLRHYAGQGISFLYVGFHYEELSQICDRVALMSNGRVIKVLDSEETTSQALEICSNAFSGKVKKQMESDVCAVAECPCVFEARDICGTHIHHLSFTVTAGECVVVQSVDDHIFGELLDILTGNKDASAGSMLLAGRRVRSGFNREIAVIQELPTKSMLFYELNYLDNLCFCMDHRLPEVWRNSGVREGVRREFAPLLGQDVFDRRVSALSEIQKYELVYARIAIQKPKIVFCVQPFRRADMELRMHIWEQMKMLLDKGIAVVILAINLADSLSLSDKLIRVRKDGPEEVYLRSEFAAIPISAPWMNLYQKT